MSATDPDASVGGRLGQELQAGTYPSSDSARFLQARDKDGEWSVSARGHLASELHAAKAKGDWAGVDGVIAALEDRR